MSLALVALLALVAALLVGAFRADLNVGLLAFAAAYPLGFAAGLTPAEVAALFPNQLVLTVLGVSLFFELVGENGTLARLTGGLLRLAQGDGRWLPVAFFGLAFGLSALGPGNIAAVALLAPVALPAGVRAGASPLLMTVALCTGANAGAFSPVAVAGGLNAALLQEIGLGGAGLPFQVFATVAAMQSLSAAGGWVLLGGFRRAGAGVAAREAAGPTARLARRHRLTLLAVFTFLLAVVGFGASPAAVAFGLAALLAAARLADLERAVRALPWSVVLLIAGVGTLVNLLGTTGSLDLLVALLARYAAPGTLNALLALVSGLASIGSSSSGVVMPLLVPLVPELVAQVGSGNPVEAVIAVDVGSHMVDVSPLSTLGALCLAALPDGADRASVFRGLLAWGLAMALVGALFAFVFLDLL